jgi:protein ImuA
MFSRFTRCPRVALAECADHVATASLAAQGGAGFAPATDSNRGVEGSVPAIYSNPRLARLAEEMARIGAQRRRPLPRCPSGLAALDVALGGGFARGAIHEFLAPGGGAAAWSVALLTATRAADRHRWIFYIDTTYDFYPPEAVRLGVPPERLVVIHAARRADALWSGEQSLRCPSVATVILPLRSIDPQTSRRLQLAAETGGNLGLLIRSDERHEPTFAASRMRFDPLSGGRGGRRALVSILRLREGQPPDPFVLDLPDVVGPAPNAQSDRWEAHGVASAG